MSKDNPLLMEKKTVFLGGGEDSFAQQKEMCLDWISNPVFSEFVKALFDETKEEHATYCVDYAHIHDPGFSEDQPFYRPSIFNQDLIDVSELPSKKVLDAFYELEASIGKDDLARCSIIDVYKKGDSFDRVVFSFEYHTFLVRGNPYNMLYDYTIPFTYDSERIDDPTKTWKILYARLILEPETWYLIQFNYETDFDGLPKQMQEWYAMNK